MAKTNERKDNSGALFRADPEWIAKGETCPTIAAALVPEGSTQAAADYEDLKDVDD